jgi:hypothetical protein
MQGKDALSTLLSAPEFSEIPMPVSSQADRPDPSWAPVDGLALLAHMSGHSMIYETAVDFDVPCAISRQATLHEEAEPTRLACTIRPGRRERYRCIFSKPRKGLDHRPNHRCDDTRLFRLGSAAADHQASERHMEGQALAANLSTPPR